MELDTIDAIQSGNRAAAIDHMKAILGDKALDVVDAQRQAIAQQMFGDAIGAEPAEEPTDEVETTADAETPEAPEPVVEPTLPDSSPEVADTLAKASAAIAGEQPQDEVTPEEPTDETDQGTE